MKIDKSLTMLAERALSEWLLEGARLEPISIWENVVFRVNKDGQTYVLRIHRSWYHTLEELNSELVWTAALREYGLNVPEPLLTKDGQGYITKCLPGSDETRNIGVLKWVEGNILGDVIKPDSKDLNKVCDYFEQLGSIAAVIHNQSAVWNVPAGFTRHAFDVEGLVGDTPFWGPFWALPQLLPQQRDLLEKARKIIGETLAAYGKSPDTYSMIHADLHMGNLVVGRKGIHVIDFDDAGFGWHQYELAVALHSYRDHPKFEMIVKAFFNGYRKDRALDAESIALLPLFLLVRTLVNLSWIQQRPELGQEREIPAMIEEACKEVDRFLAA